MIVIKAQLLRGAVFLAGESIECLITFTNTNDVSTDLKVSSNLENLAWVTAQIHCQCSIKENRVKLVPDKLSSPGDNKAAPIITGTSLVPSRGEKGQAIFSTSPKILCCDLILQPGQSKSFLYQDNIPSDVPPSYKGYSVKYSYKLTIGTQRVNSVIQLLRIPIKVLFLSGFYEASSISDDGEVQPANPFLQTEKKGAPLDLALQLIQNVTTRKNSNYYSITNNQGKVVRLSMFKHAYKLGEDIVGLFDFTQGSVPCYQFLVTLQSEETVAADYQRKSGQESHVVSHNKYHEVCLNMSQTQMILPIPLHITPTFTTEMVSLQWKLHFEFVTTTSGINKSIDSMEPWSAPESIDIETMVWDLPLIIYPTNPVNVSQGLQMESNHELKF